MFGFKPTSFIAAVAVISPARQRLHTVLNSSVSTSTGLRPLYLPSAFAISIPSRCLSKMFSRSNSASAPKTVSINLPCGVVVSILSLRLTNSTPFSVSSEMIESKSRVFLAIREILSTITISPTRTKAIISLNARRSVFFPLALSVKIFSAFCSFIIFNCLASFCSIVEHLT